MSHSIVCTSASQWFSENHRLAYWMAQRWCQRLLAYRGRFVSSNELDELAQDAVCRGYDRFLKRCTAQACGASDCRRWACQCLIFAAKDAIRAKSTFGSITSGTAVRDDVMNRRVRVNPGFVHGSDDEQQDALAQVEYQPVPSPVQRWELEQVAHRELPADLAEVCTLVATGLTQLQVGLLLGVTARTIRKRLQAARQYLG